LAGITLASARTARRHRRQPRRRRDHLRVGLAHQRGQGVAREAGLLLQRLDLLARLGQAAFALAQLQRRVQAGVDAVAHQPQRLLALGQGALGDGELVVGPRQLEVGAGDVAGQQDAGGLGLGLRSTGGAQRAIEQCAVLAEEVDLPAGVQLQRPAGAGGAGQRRRNHAVLGVALGGDVQLAADLRQQRAARHFADSLGPCQPCLRDAQVRVVGQCLFDQAAQLLVAELAPPLHRQRRRRRGIQLQRRAVFEFGLWFDAGQVGAARQQQGRGQRRQLGLLVVICHSFPCRPGSPGRCPGCGAAGS
jgi:hypothetical protein